MNRTVFSYRTGLAACLSAALAASASAQVASSTSFTYQGRLALQGQAFTGTADYVFTLWDSPSGGAQIGASLPVNGQAVTNGLFSTPLDFGAGAFNGSVRWVSVDVRTPAWNGQGSPPAYTSLNPRQAVTPAPYATYSQRTNGINVNSGRVSVGGDPAPSAAFEVGTGQNFGGNTTVGIAQGVADVTGLSLRSVSGDPLVQLCNTSACSYIGMNQAGNLYLSGNVGVATSYPTATLQVGDSGDFGNVTSVGIWQNPAETVGLSIRSDSNGYNPTLQFCMDGACSYLTANNAGNVYFYGGNVGIGTGSPSEALDVVGNIHTSGSVFTSCGTLSCSDERFKKNIAKVSDALDLVEKISAFRYEWRRDEFPERQFDNGAQIGFIAQELRTILPEAVRQDGTGYLAVDYSRVTPLLVEAVKQIRAEKDAQVSKMQAENDGLKARLERLEARVK